MERSSGVYGNGINKKGRPIGRPFFDFIESFLFKINQEQIFDQDLGDGMALAFVIGPLVVTKAAIDGNALAFFHVFLG